MPTRWLLQKDVHWCVLDIRHVTHRTKALYPRLNHALCLIKALVGECIISYDNHEIRLAGSRMALVDTQTDCVLSEASGDLKLELITIGYEDGYLIGDTPLQLCERFSEYRRFCYMEPKPLVFDDTYALIVPLMKNLEAFLAFGLLDLRVQLIHLYITYIVLVIVCAAEESERFESTGNRHVRSALHWIQQHYMSNLNTAEIAEHVGIHPGHLHRLFYAELGIHIRDYILQRRMEHVRFLLVHTDFPVSEIAQLAGISSQHYLSRMFKKTTGMTPSAFRQCYNITRVFDYDVLEQTWTDEDER